MLGGLRDEGRGLWAGVEGEQGLAEMSGTTLPGDEQLATRRDRIESQLGDLEDE